jgi:YfiH family protein
MIITPQIFDQFPEIIAAQSTRLGGVSPEPLGMNLSSHVGDEQANVDENRRRFFEAIGVPKGMKAVYQNQIHSSNINVVNGGEGVVKDSDALITGEPNVLLGVSVADCTPILLYEPKAKLIAAVHAGWRGTEQMIALAAIRKMIELGGLPENIFAFIGASASGEKYEVGLEVATLFEGKHLVDLHNGKFLLDVKAANLDQLLFAGVPAKQIEVSPLCTITDERLHSYRRDGKRSGRMLAVIERISISSQHIDDR